MTTALRATTVCLFCFASLVTGQIQAQDFYDHSGNAGMLQPIGARTLQPIAQDETPIANSASGHAVYPRHEVFQAEVPLLDGPWLEPVFSGEPPVELNVIHEFDLRAQMQSAAVPLPYTNSTEPDENTDIARSIAEARPEPWSRITDARPLPRIDSGRLAHSHYEHESIEQDGHEHRSEQLTSAETNYDPNVAPASYNQQFGFPFPGFPGSTDNPDTQANANTPAGPVAQPDNTDGAHQLFYVPGTAIPIDLFRSHTAHPHHEPTDNHDLRSEIEREIKAHKSELEHDVQIDDAQKTELLGILSAATAELHKHEASESKLKQFEAEMASFPDELIELEARLSANPLPAPLPVAGPNTPAVELQLLKTELDDEQARLSTLQHTSDEQRDRITKIPEIRAEVRNQMQDVEARLTQTDHDDHELVYSWILLSAQQLALSERSKMLAAEVQWQEVAGKVLPMRHDVSQRYVRLLSEQVANWEQELAGLRRREIEKQAEEARALALNAHPALKKLALRNQELTEKRIEAFELIKTAEKEKTAIDAKIADVHSRRETMTSRIETAGVTVANGALLVENRRVLLPPFESYARIREIDTELQAVNTKLLRLDEEREPLALPREFVNSLLPGTNGSSLTQDDLADTALKMTETKRQYLDDLRSDFDRYRGLLSDLATQRQTLVTETVEARSFIDEHALWIRSTATIGPADLKPAARGLATFFAAGEWSKLGSELLDSLLHKPQRTALWVVSLAGLVLFTRSIKPRTETRRGRQAVKETTEAAIQFRDSEN